jgi:hypothetical protein
MLQIQYATPNSPMDFENQVNKRPHGEEERIPGVDVQRSIGVKV